MKSKIALWLFVMFITTCFSFLIILAIGSTRNNESDINVSIYLVHPYVCKVIGDTVTIELDHIDIRKSFNNFTKNYTGYSIRTKYINNIQPEDRLHFPESLWIPMSNIKYTEKF